MSSFAVFRAVLKKALYPFIYRVCFKKMGVPPYFCSMFLRKKKNHSGSISIQIISKVGGKYRVIKTIGSGRTEKEIEGLFNLGKQEMKQTLLKSKY